MHCARDHTRVGQVAAGNRNARCIDAIRIEWTNQALKRRIGSAPGGMLNIVAQPIEAAIFARSAFDASKERRADLANQRLGGVNGGQTFLDFLIG